MQLPAAQRAISKAVNPPVITDGPFPESKELLGPILEETYGIPVYQAPVYAYAPQPQRGLSITALVLGAFDTAAHPNAALVFLDFVMSEEGQTALNGDGFRAAAVEEEKPLDDNMRRFIWMLRGAGLLGLFVGGIGVANTISVLLAGRTAEIAVRKTMGYPAGALYVLSRNGRVYRIEAAG